MSSPEMRVQNTSRPVGNSLPLSFRPPVRADTPDPNGYTNLRDTNIYLEFGAAAGRQMSSMVPGGRGTMIPRASRDGASRGVDHYAPQIVNIDPQFGGVVVDMASIDNDVLDRAVEEANLNYDDPSEAAYAAYATLADPSAQPHPDNAAVRMQPSDAPRAARSVAYDPGQGESQTVYGRAAYSQGSEEPRYAPINMPGAYVVPAASAGGGQVAPRQQSQQPRRAEAAPQPQQLRGRTPQSRRPPVREQVNPEAYEEYAPEKQAEARPASFSEVPAESVRRIRGPLPQSLRESFQEAPRPVPMLQVTFELSQGGQFECMYHQVLVEKASLVLVLDHRQFMQMRYFPPTCEEPMAVLVRPPQGDPRLFLCHTTGIRFQHEHYEYYVLLIDEEKDLKGQEVDS